MALKIENESRAADGVYTADLTDEGVAIGRVEQGFDDRRPRTYVVTVAEREVTTSLSMARLEEELREPGLIAEVESLALLVG